MLGSVSALWIRWPYSFAPPTENAPLLVSLPAMPTQRLSLVQSTSVASFAAAAVAVRLHVICAGEPSDRVREWFNEWEDNARAQAADVGITLHTTRHHDARSMDVTLSDRLTELDIP